MEEITLTSGASTRIIPLFNKAKSMAIFLIPSFHFIKETFLLFYTSFLCFLLLLIPRSHRSSETPSSAAATVKVRRRRSVEEEEDTIRRRSIAETLDMVPPLMDDDGEGDCKVNCKWRTLIFYGVRNNALFSRSWFPVNGDLK